jgi:4'-phosphopantetheinyl transferase
MSTTRTEPMHADAAAAPWRFGRFQVWPRAHAPRQRGEPGAREVLAQALDLPAANVPIQRDVRGKPYLDAPYQAQQVSWSHSGALLLVALGPARDLGVDVEQFRERPRMMDIAARFFHPSELDWLRAQPEGERTAVFVRLWCAKEAVLKAHGQGISFGLEKLVFGERQGRLQLLDCAPELGEAHQWQLHEWQPQPGYRGALAWRD